MNFLLPWIPFLALGLVVEVLVRTEIVPAYLLPATSDVLVSLVRDHKELLGIMDISENEAIEMSRKLAKTEGIFAGMSSGGAASASIRLAGELKEGLIVFIACDRGDRYLSSNLFG